MSKIDPNKATLTGGGLVDANSNETLTLSTKRKSITRAPINNIWQPGEVLDNKYKIQEKIGQGGMGVVYRVSHMDWGIDMAMKTPIMEMTDASARERYVQEAQTWIDLGMHPNIAQCWYVRFIDDVLCLFSEFIDGGSLEDWLMSKRKKQDKWHTILDLTIQACDGLAYAHSYGVVHRDVKPGNMLITSNGRLCVTDFGIAKVQGANKIHAGEISPCQDAGHSLPQTGFGLGTPQYGAPEQWDDSQPVDARADIYALGVMVYELICGRRPFDDDHNIDSPISIIWRHMTEEPPDPRTFFPDIPKSMINLTRCCLAKDPDDRPNSMSEIRAHLIKIYKEFLGKNYSRPEPDLTELKAGSLNNKAISLWDLNKKKEALKLFKEALAADPRHLEATKNFNLIRWQQAFITDTELRGHLHNLRSSHKNRPDFWRVMAEIELSRGDIESANTAIREANRIQSDAVEIDRLFQVVDKRRKEEEYCKQLRYSLADPKQQSIAANFDEGLGYSGCSDGTIQIWGIRSGSLLFSIEHHAEAVNKLVLTRDGKYLISASDDWNIGIFDAQTGRALHMLEGHRGPVTALSLTNRDDMVVSASQDHTFRVWNLEKFTCVGVFRGQDQNSPGHSQSVTHIASHPRQSVILSASADRTLRLIDTQKGVAKRVLEGHDAAVMCAVFTADGRKAISCGKDKRIIRWGLETGNPELFYKGHLDTVTSLVITPDGRHIISGSVDKTMRIWDLQTGVCLRTFSEQNDVINNIVSSSSGNQIFVQGGNRKNYLWRINYISYQVPLDLSKIEEVSSLRKTQQKAIDDMKKAQQALDEGDFHKGYTHIRKVRQMDGFERDSRQLAIWRKLTSRFPRCGLCAGWNKKIYRGHTDRVTSLAVDYKNGLMVSGSDDCTVRLWDLNQEECIHTFQESADAVKTVNFSPHGDKIIAGSTDEFRPEETLRIWDTDKKKEETPFEGHIGYIRCASFAGDNRWVISESPDVLEEPGTLWARNSTEGKCVQRYLGHQDVIYAIATDPVGKYAVTGSADQSIRIWQINNGNCLKVLKGHQGAIYSVAISPDHQFLLSSGEDRTIRLWSFYKGECLRVLRNNQGPVASIAFSSDGRFCFSTDNNTIYLWDLSVCEKIYSFDGHGGNVNMIQVVDNDRFLVSAADDCTIRLWELDWDISPSKEQRKIGAIYGIDPSQKEFRPDQINPETTPDDSKFKRLLKGFRKIKQ
ncbi:MAG: protein kinase domain-containing protein [Marinilabiliaceae bacterium]